MKILLGVLVLLVTSSAYGGSYIGISQSQIDYEEKGFSGLDFETRGLIFGYEIGNNAAVELRYSKGSKDDTFNGYNIKLDYTYGIYGKYSFNSSAPVTPYVLLGYTKGEVSAKGIGSETESDLSYGAGFSVGLTESISIAAEYMVLIKKKGGELNATSINLTYEF